MVSVGLLALAGMAPTSARGASAVQTGPSSTNPTGYFVDLLFRGDHPPSGDVGASRAEAGRIFAMDAAAWDFPADDRAYVARLVAGQTGQSQAGAEKRVSDVVERAKAQADAARKTGVNVALWAFISLPVGAFSASCMATIGGRVRDDLPMTDRPRRRLAATRPRLPHGKCRGRGVTRISHTVDARSAGLYMTAIPNVLGPGACERMGPFVFGVLDRGRPPPDVGATQPRRDGFRPAPQTWR